MKLWKEENYFRIADSSVRYAAALEYHFSDLIVAVDIENHAFAWKSKTMEPVMQIPNAVVLPGNEENYFLVSADLKAVLEIQTEERPHVIDQSLIIIQSNYWHFNDSVYQLSQDGTEWRQIFSPASHLELDNYINNNFCSGLLLEKIGEKRVLITDSKIISGFMPSVKFLRCESDQIVFQDGTQYGVYDISTHRELFRRGEYPECPEMTVCGNEIIWYGVGFRYADGQMHEILKHVRNQTICGIVYENSQDKVILIKASPKPETTLYYLVSLRTGKESEAFSETVCMESQPENNRCILRNGKYGVIDLNQMTYIIPPEYDEIRYIKKNNTYILQKNDEFGRADSKGNIITPVIWSYMAPNDSGNHTFVLLQTEDKVSFLSTETGFCAEPFFGEVLFGACKNMIGFRKYPDSEKKDKPVICFMNFHTGEVFLEGQYDNAERLVNDFILLSRENLKGVYDIAGKKFLSPLSYCCVTVHQNQILVTSLETGTEKFINIEEEFI